MMSNRSSSHSNHVPSLLMRESLVDKDLIAATQSPVVRILPNINVIQIGGKIMDRGREALLPLLDEIVENQTQHTQVIAVGAGIRSRHLFAVGIDLGLPTGVLATLSAKDAAQNAYMVSCLLAKHGFVYLEAPFVVQLLPARSEEHTSELQSLTNLVCRLLLEKKNKEPHQTLQY